MKIGARDRFLSYARLMKKASFVAAFLLAVLCGQSVEGKPAPDHELTPGQRLIVTSEFKSWKPHFIQRAQRANISDDTIRAVLARMTVNDEVVWDKWHQPESHLTFDEYWNKSVKRLIPTGRQMLAAHRDEIIEAEHRAQAIWDQKHPDQPKSFDIPPEIVVALWGMESTFGTTRGDIKITEALATLAAIANDDAEKRKFFEDQLIAEMELIDDGKVDLNELGSWAGADGDVQFMPSNIKHIAVDADGDGHIRLDNAHLLDVFASAASLLVHDGWIPGQACGWRIDLPPGFSKGHEGEMRTLNEWAYLGVRQWNGDELPDDDRRPVRFVLFGRNPKAGEPDRREPFLADEELTALHSWNGGYFAGEIKFLAAAIAAP